MMTMGKSIPAISSRMIAWNAVSCAAGNEACAQNRASTREVVATSRERPFTIW